MILIHKLIEWRFFLQIGPPTNDRYGVMTKYNSIVPNDYTWDHHDPNNDKQTI